MKILLAGARGLLGRALQRELAHHEWVALGRQEMDIARLEQVTAALQRHRPEVVVNAAAFTDVDRAQSEADAAFRDNALGPRNLALASARAGLPLVHISTDYVFDGLGKRPYHEFDLPNPISVYGRSKLAGEQQVAIANARHYIVRSAWLYDVGGHNFLNAVYTRQAEPEVRVIGDQFGSPTYAPHLCQALDQLIGSGAHGLYHLAGAGGTSRFEMTRHLYREIGVATPVVAIATADLPRPAPRPPYAVLTTLQDPEIRLPAWEVGVSEFARQLTAESRAASRKSSS